MTGLRPVVHRKVGLKELDTPGTCSLLAFPFLHASVCVAGEQVPEML